MSLLHIYWDESGKYKNNQVVCLAALCIRAESLAYFNCQWQNLLRQYELGELHMVEVSRLSQSVGSRFQKGQTAEQRMVLLRPFADCINDQMEAGLVQIADPQGFASIPDKQRKALSGLKDPYHLALIRGMAEVAQYEGEDPQLAIICDDDEETAWESYRLYRQLRQVRHGIRDKVKSFSFADSVTFPALQAADMISYLGRKEGEYRWQSKPYEFQELLAYITNRQVPGKWKVAQFCKATLQNARNWRTNEG